MAPKKKLPHKKSIASQSGLKTMLKLQPLRNMAEKRRQLRRIQRWNAGMLVFAAFLLGVGSGAVGWLGWHSNQSPPVDITAQPIGYGEGWDSLDARADGPISAVQAPQTASDSARPLSNLIQSSQKLGPHVRVPILMYHYIRFNPVATDKIGYGLSVTPSNFTSQMAYLATHGYHAISVSDVVDALHGIKTLPAKPVAITFDDGYDDLFTAAYPVLQKYGLHGESYVITGQVGMPGYVTWDMLRQMEQSGVVTIGAHTIHHYDLAKLSEDEQRQEIAGSRAALQSQLGIPVNDFCYPSGQYSAQTIEIVKQAGFKDATTVRPGSIEYTGQEMTLPRVRVAGGETLDEFAKRLEE